MLKRIFLFTFLVSLQASSQVVPYTQQNPTKHMAEPWMQELMDETVQAYKDKFKQVAWSNDQDKVTGRGFNQAAVQIAKLFKQFETEKAPTLREKIRELITNKDAMMPISQMIGTAYRDWHIRSLWVKNSNREDVDPNEIAPNLENLEFIDFYGTSVPSLTLDGVFVNAPKIAFFTDNTKKIIYAFEALQSPDLYLKHKPDASQLRKK